jgi:hypothetical protein
MSVLDVRNDKVQEFTTIRFADQTGRNSVTHAHELMKWENSSNMIVVADSDYDVDESMGYVVVSSAEHANDLIKALKKAIELGWLN